ncbi:LapA family protein [Labilibacter marinus]|uniref:LapA family protein n=1 Tax=Labilibacter marinus TaxID=1477105 RepID=UPI000835157C|nr:LapA family protein [Labilibacter marinus]
MENKKTNWFVRILILMLSLLITVLISYNFFIAKPQGEISNGLVTLIMLLIIVVLSEAFDNISFGKILSLNREVKEKSKEVKELKVEKEGLLNMLVNNISVQTQSVGISGNELKEILTVIKADPERIEEETKEKEDLHGEEDTTPNKKRLDIRKFEKTVLNQFIEANNYTNYLFNEQVTFSKSFNNVDPISRISPIFDGYIETSDSEIFVEVKPRISKYNRDYLYLRLSALYHYRKAKNIKAYLLLILVELPEDLENSSPSNTNEKALQHFEPAIELGLLKVKTMKLTKEQTQDIYR